MGIDYDINKRPLTKLRHIIIICFIIVLFKLKQYENNTNLKNICPIENILHTFNKNNNFQNK